MAAFSDLSGIPIVGPALGAIAAAAVLAFGVESIQKVNSAADGALVGGAGFKDSQPFMLTPGELVVPRQNFEEVVSAISNQRANEKEGVEESETGGGNMSLLIGFETEEASDMLTVKQNEDSFLGISQQIA